MGKKGVLNVFQIFLVALLVLGFSSQQSLAKDRKGEDTRSIEEILEAEGIPLKANPEPMDLEDLSNYTLGPDDIIEIKVLRHPEVSGMFTINSEGKIQYEFVGDVDVAGKTKEEVRKDIHARLSKYIITPDVGIKIVGYNSKIVYVIGEVGRPGKVFMKGDTITIREALIEAGLPLLTAKQTKSKLITPSADGKALEKKVDVHKLLVEGDLRENLVMSPGDTLYLPPTAMAKALRIIQPVAAPIHSGVGAGRAVGSN